MFRSRFLELDWSRREELNTPSTGYDSVALTLSYTGEFLFLCYRVVFTENLLLHQVLQLKTVWRMGSGTNPPMPLYSRSLTNSSPFSVNGM